MSCGYLAGPLELGAWWRYLEDRQAASRLAGGQMVNNRHKMIWTDRNKIWRRCK